jgi:hypothetical protein
LNVLTKHSVSKKDKMKKRKCMKNCNEPEPTQGVGTRLKNVKFGL